MFKDVVSSSFNGWKFSWNPCIPFTEGNCRNVAVCELSDDGYAFYNLGTQDSAWFLTVSGVFQLSYNASDEGFPRVTYVTLVCDPSQEKTLDALGPLYSATYGFVLTSKYCCPRRETTGLSAGSILLIVFFVLLFVYIVGGVAFQVGVRKSSGKEIIPNYTWWFSLPTLIKDGVKFTVSCGKMSYEKL
ncbi:uncharacterized protein LOC112565231 isoform X2 [Pomacea canaliculata]|nr:uncharacterized protein LOC112565231 isoform X2 [Pomacea canaliculata]